MAEAETIAGLVLGVRCASLRVLHGHLKGNNNFFDSATAGHSEILCEIVLGACGGGGDRDLDVPAFVSSFIEEGCLRTRDKCSRSRISLWRALTLTKFVSGIELSE
jgi:hypothetical protein